MDKGFEQLFAMCRALRRNAHGIEGVLSTLKLTEFLEKEDIQLSTVGEECKKVHV